MATTPKPISKPTAIPVPVDLPPIPDTVTSDEPGNALAENTKLEQEAGRKALDAFAARTNAEYAAGQRMLKQRSGTIKKDTPKEDTPKEDTPKEDTPKKD